jgi:hypothetical protein
MNMKKYLVSLTMLMTLGMGLTAAAQGQQMKEQQELVDSTHQDDALEVYSDTTGSRTYDSTVVSRTHRIGGYVSGNSIVHDIFGNIDMDGMVGMTFALMVILIIFVFSPLFILGLILFFIYRNRKQKMRLAEMAMKQGQPIPDQLLTEHEESDDELWKKGLRQTFLGVGLLAFFGYVGSTLGIGIGILVTVIGLGKLAIVKTTRH